MFPKILHLTCKDKNNIDNHIWRQCYKKFKKMYTGYEIILYDNQDIYKIVRENFPKDEPVIRSVQNGGAIADTFRYLILYLKGGVYADMDCEPLQHIDNLFNDFIYFHGNEGKFSIVNSNNPDYFNTFKINPCSKCKQNENINNFICGGHKLIDPEKTSIIISNEFSKFYGCNTKQAGQCCQWFIIAKPKLFLFKALYHQCIKNIISKKYLISVHDYTGPLLFTQMLNIYMKSNDNHGITILPPDVFCVGSSIPYTKNGFIRHHFTGSWHDEENKRKMKPLSLVK